MAYSAKILADSVNKYTGKRLTTFEITYPRFVHSELMTHRVFSRNSASSRAIPVKKLISQVRKDPVLPVWWGKTQSGMQAKEQVRGWRKDVIVFLWLQLRWVAIFFAWSMMKLGLHKQIANRVLEPWMWITVIVSGTEFDNFFKLRCHPDAQPEIAKIATLMRFWYECNKPTILAEGEWHLPLLPDINDLHGVSIDDLCKISTGRVARVSYLTHDGKRDPQADIDLCGHLSTSGHWSPFEHIARPLKDSVRSGNFTGGWQQYRHIVDPDFLEVV